MSALAIVAGHFVRFVCASLFRGPDALWLARTWAAAAAAARERKARRPAVPRCAAHVRKRRDVQYAARRAQAGAAWVHACFGAYRVQVLLQRLHNFQVLSLGSEPAAILERCFPAVAVGAQRPQVPSA